MAINRLSSAGEIRLLYVRRRLPLLGRLFLGLFGLVCIGLSGFMAFAPATMPKTLSFWFLALAVGGMGYVFFQTAGFKGALYFDPSSRDLIVITRGVLPHQRLQRFPTTHLHAVRTHYSRGLTGAHWEIWLDPTEGEARLFTLLSASEPADEVAQIMAHAAGIIAIHEGT